MRTGAFVQVSDGGVFRTTSVQFQVSASEARVAPLDVSHHFNDAERVSLTDEDYRRLGDFIRAGRLRAGYKTRGAFAAQVDVTTRTLADIENGILGRRKEFSRETLAAIEEVVGWYPGATRYVLEHDDVAVDDLVSSAGVPAGSQQEDPGDESPRPPSGRVKRPTRREAAEGLIAAAAWYMDQGEDALAGDRLSEARAILTDRRDVSPSEESDIIADALVSEPEDAVHDAKVSEPTEVKDLPK